MDLLTPRQRTFLRELVLLYRQEGRAVHYSEVATRLGVNRFSAYDMLKVLEEKGLAHSEYLLGSDSPGPGRTQVVFSPTAQAHTLVAQTDEGRFPSDDWLLLKERILSRLRNTREAPDRDTLQETLTCLPEGRSPLAYCAEMVAALLLNLNRVKAKVIGISPYEVLEGLVTRGESGLGALAGLSLGSSLAAAVDRADRVLVETLYANVRRYEDALANLSEESKWRLSELTREAVRIFANQGTTG